MIKVRYQCILLVLTIHSGFLTGCKKKPSSCIAYEEKIGEVDKAVTFKNCSSNAENYTWRYGDGTTEDKENGYHIYQETGKYGVKLVAYTKHFKEKDEATVWINIGERAISKIVINNISFSRKTGEPWDNDGTEPDVFVKVINTSTQTVYYTSDIFYNFTSSLFPLQLDLTDYSAKPGDFGIIIDLFDSDGTESEKMVSFVFYLKDKLENPIKLITGDFKLDVYWEVV